MRNKSMLPIQVLVPQALKNTKYHTRWVKALMTAAWNQLFPQLTSELKKLFIKEKVLYISLNSLILSNDLRRKSKIVLEQLKIEIQKLGQDADIIDAIVFL